MPLSKTAHMRSHVARPVISCATLLVLGTAPAAAQTAPKWEVEFHAGGLVASNPTGGTTALPPAGPGFTTSVGRTSRRASSWYFGDGAALLNEIQAAFGTPASQRITPLNDVLNAPLATRRNGVAFGFRVSRAITSRLAAEATVDFSPAKLEMTRDAERSIETTRTGFETAFNGLLAGAPVSGRTVTSRSTLQDSSGGQLLTSGTLNLALRTTGNVIPYVTGGAGVISALGDQPGATLEGNYRFSLVGIYPMDEKDLVTVRVSVPDNDLVGVVGAGARYVASPRWGMRVDGRVYLGRDRLDTVVDASPSVAANGPVSPAPLSSSTTPSIQFSNNPPGTGPQSNLTGEAITGFRTYEGSGVRSQFALTAGLFWRF
jgi:hypothetical protein